MTRPLDSRRLARRSWPVRPLRLGAALAGASAAGTWRGTHEPQISGVHVGFAGQYKLGYWTPVEVTVRSRRRTAGGRPGADGARRRRRAEPGARRVGPVAAGRGRGAIADGLRQIRPGRRRACDVELREACRGELLAERSLRQGSDQLPAPLPAGTRLLVMVGPADARSDARGRRWSKDWQAAVARLAGVELLPTRWYGYEGVDLVVLSTVRAGDLSARCPDERLAALDQWVRLGGRLLLAVGSTGRGGFGPRGAAGPLCAGQIRRDDSAAADRCVGNICRHERAAGSRDSARAFRLDVPKLVDVRGRIEAYEGNHPRDLPLVVRSPVRIGRSDLRRLGSGSAAVSPLARAGKFHRPAAGQARSGRRQWPTAACWGT